MAKLNRTHTTEGAGDASWYLPEGDYDFVIEEASVETSKAGNEMIFLKLVHTKQSGGRIEVKDWILTEHSNPTAVDINSKKIARLLKSVGLDSLDDTDDLVDLTARAHVGIREGLHGDSENEVKYFIAEGREPVPENSGGGFPDGAPGEFKDADVEDEPEKSESDLDDDLPF